MAETENASKVVRREGPRVMGRDGRGYNDAVTNEYILRAVAEAEKRMAEDRAYVAFAYQVLAFRAGEAS